MTMTTERTQQDAIRNTVRDHYASVAEAETGTAGGPTCCGGSAPDASIALGYSEDEVGAVPEGANMGLGCGNPQALAALKPGETVIDLGSGGGFDCFLAARQVGDTGSVVGVDMTPVMISKARANADTLGSKNVSFRLGEIEHLPVADNVADVILSNCVINLSPAKEQVFREALRVLKPGGRLAIKDIVALAPLPDAIRAEVNSLSACVSGAVEIAVIERSLVDAGFDAIRVTVDPASSAFIKEWLPGSGAENYVASASIEATKALSIQAP